MYQKKEGKYYKGESRNHYFIYKVNKVAVIFGVERVDVTIVESSDPRDNIGDEYSWASRLTENDVEVDWEGSNAD